MRFLAIDLGDKRTGLAVGDDVTGLASPVGLIEQPVFGRVSGAAAGAAAGGAARVSKAERAFSPLLLQAIDRAIEAHLGPGDGLVVGLALNMDGSGGPRAALARRFAAELGARTGREVHLQDERRTSVAADERLARSGLTHDQKKRRRDAIAAAEVLRRFLDARSLRFGVGGGGVGDEGGGGGGAGFGGGSVGGEAG